MEKVLIPCLSFALSFSLACAGVKNVMTLNAELPLVNGLSWMFYKSTCPNLESIVEKRIKKFDLKKDITQATPGCYVFTFMTVLSRLGFK
ncbi:hypothetical protein SUGI_0481450 [Cryptomeria japonica]|nr:hypothetical protein SUGI_0481450 [Cryptomeria japonica]